MVIYNVTELDNITGDLTRKTTLVGDNVTAYDILFNNFKENIENNRGAFDLQSSDFISDGLVKSFIDNDIIINDPQQLVAVMIDGTIHITHTDPDC